MASRDATAEVAATLNLCQVCVHKLHHHYAGAWCVVSLKAPVGVCLDWDSTKCPPMPPVKAAQPAKEAPMTEELNNVTKAQMERAFEAWENGYRIEPDKYRTPEECAGLPVTQVSAERADYFFELLTLQQSERPAPPPSAVRGEGEVPTRPA